jgi:flagellar hook protein FlgE
MGDVRLPLSGTPARPTGRIDMQLNLDSRTEVGGPFDLTRPDETSQFVTALSIFDSVGNPHSLNVYFTKSAENTWEWHAMGDGGDVSGGEKGKLMEIAAGQVTFDQLGKLYSQQQSLANVTFANGAVPDQKLDFSFGDPIDQNGTGISGTTQYGSKSNALRTLQDGFAAGVILDTQIDQDGILSGTYSNGQTKILGQLAVARFDAPERLARFGENQFRETQESGVASIGKARTTGRGAVMSKNLEGSNVDLAKEFVEMIRSQRGFQASAKSISTSNEMLEEVINIRGR